MPRFSVIIPCYNAAQTLPETLRSIAAQSCGSWEAICVDDGSTDKTKAIVSDLSKRDPRFKLASNPGKGPSSARNHGAFNLATGDIIAFCDADDLWSPSKLAELDTAFRDLFVDAAFGRVAFFCDDPTAPSAYSTVPVTPLDIPSLLAENPICTMSSIAIRRAAFTQSKGFDEKIVHNEDLEWLVRLVGGGATVIGLDQCQTWYRASPFGLSADLSAMADGRGAVLNTAKSFGYAPSAASNAIYQRYLARRSLRLGQGRTQALRFALRGLTLSPTGFFATPKRGLLTLLGALLALVLPAPVSRTLFAR